MILHANPINSNRRVYFSPNTKIETDNSRTPNKMAISGLVYLLHPIIIIIRSSLIIICITSSSI
jgi:hypothetical protein